jgi:hypothetical protein
MLRREISEGNGNGKLWMTRQAAVETRGKKSAFEAAKGEREACSKKHCGEPYVESWRTMEARKQRTKL